MSLKRNVRPEYCDEFEPKWKKVIKVVHDPNVNIESFSHDQRYCIMVSLWMFLDPETIFNLSICKIWRNVILKYIDNDRDNALKYLSQFKKRNYGCLSNLNVRQVKGPVIYQMLRANLNYSKSISIFADILSEMHVTMVEQNIYHIGNLIFLDNGVFTNRNTHYLMNRLIKNGAVHVVQLIFDHFYPDGTNYHVLKECYKISIEAGHLMCFRYLNRKIQMMVEENKKRIKKKNVPYSYKITKNTFNCGTCRDADSVILILKAINFVGGDANKDIEFFRHMFIYFDIDDVLKIAKDRNVDIKKKSTMMNILSWSWNSENVFSKRVFCSLVQLINEDENLLPFLKEFVSTIYSETKLPKARMLWESRSFLYSETPDEKQ